MQAIEAVFNHLIAQYRNPESDDARNAARMLSIKQDKVPDMIEARMKYQPAFINSMGMFVDFRDTEMAFAVTVGLDPNLWVNFVTQFVTQIRGQQLKQQQQQLQQQQLQQQQLQQQQLQQQQLQQQQLRQQQLHQLEQHGNNLKIFLKILLADTVLINVIATNLGINNDEFLYILSLKENLLEDAFIIDIDYEVRFVWHVNELVNKNRENPGNQPYPMLQHELNTSKWLCFMQFLHDKGMDDPNANNNYQTCMSQALELSPYPDRGRPTPFAVVRMRQDIDIDGSHNFDQAYLSEIIHEKDVIFTEEEDKTTDEYKQKYEKYMKNKPYRKLIRNVLNKQLTPITHEEYEQLFGGAYSPKFKILPVEHILLESFKSKGFDKTLVDTAFQYACRAYLHAEPRILYELEHSEPEPKRFYVIARLMLHYLTGKFNRTDGMHLGGKKSRSKKRGRKSVHRRKKSSHKKRKSKKN